MKLEGFKRDCKFPIELLNGYIDNELDEKDRHFVEGHLKRCLYCQREIEELKRVDRYLKDYPVEGPSGDFVLGIKERVMRKIKSHKPIFLWRFIPVFASLAAAILLFIITSYERPIQIVGIEHRLVYSEISFRPDIDLVLPSITPPKAQLKLMPSAKGQLTTETPLPEKMTEVSQEYTKGEEKTVQEIEFPADKVVRAIVDSTGKVLKVATGNSLAPIEDTLIIKNLQGRQIAPPKIKGRARQMFVELGKTKKTD